MEKKFLLDIWKLLKEGDSLKVISNKLNITKQALNYYLSSLKKKGLIEKIGYGVWKTKEIEVKKIKLGNTTSKKVRGHAFVWKLRLPKFIDWKSLLEMKGYKYELVNKGTPRIIIKGKKIWLGQKNIIIYDLESYFGSNSIETKKYAIERLLSVIYVLERELGVNLKRDELYTFTVSRSHYSLLKNCLAIQCNKEGKKIQVSNEAGMWFIIDNSYNLDEAETIHPQTALTDNLGIQRYFNEHKETHFEVTPKAILNYQLENTKQLNQLTEIMNEYGKHIKSHTKSIILMSKGIKELTGIMKDLKKENDNLKQRRLGEWF